MPAKPGAHAPLEHDDVLRLVDVEDRHAVDRAARVGCAPPGCDVVRADHERDVGLLELGVDLVHLVELVVRDVRLGEQHVHVAGHPAGDRDGSRSGRRRPCSRARPRARARRAAPARPRARSPGTMTTRCAYASMTATSSAVVERTRRPPARRGRGRRPGSWPNAPKRTFAIERPIARPIISVSSVPDAPTSMPLTIRTFVVQHEAGRRRGEAR